jgi:nucleotide-binding universal stress UspA family protein
VATAASLCADDAVFDVVHVAEWPPSLSEGYSRRSKTALDPSVARAREETLQKGASWLKAATARVRDTLVHLHLDEGESTSGAILSRIERKGNDLVVLGRRAPPTRSGTLGAAVRRLLEYADVSVALVATPEMRSQQEEPQQERSQGQSLQEQQDSAR